MPIMRNKSSNAYLVFHRTTMRLVKNTTAEAKKTEELMTRVGPRDSCGGELIAG